MKKTTDFLEKLLWVYLFVNPFLDMISGAYIYIKCGSDYDLYSTMDLGVTPSLIVRMVMLLLFALYILLKRDKKAILTAVGLALAWALSIAAEYANFKTVSIAIDVQYFAKFCYNVAVLMVYDRMFTDSGMDREELFEKIQRALCIVSVCLAAGIIIPYILDFGFYTYADRFGYRGFRGIYYSGNDITATIMLGMPVTLCKYVTLYGAPRKTRLFYGAAPVLSMLCLVVIGTKTAFAAVFISLVFLLVYGIRQRKRDKNDKTLFMLLTVVIGVVVSAALLSLLAWRSVLTTIIASILGIGDAASESAKTLILSGRQVRLASNFKDYASGGVLTWLFGLGRGSRETTMEMDLFEVVFYYGVFGAFAMLRLYLKTGISFVVRFFKSFSLRAMGIFITLGVCVAYLTIAGHVLFSVTSGFYFAFMLALAKLEYREQ